MANNDKQLRTMKKLSTIAIALSIIAIAGVTLVFATRITDSEELHRQAIRSSYHVYAPVIPDTMTFAGERVPLDLFYVHEGLDRELSSIMYQQLNTQLVIKRTGRYFPLIEKILAEYDIPEDFKYLCVTESSLTNATSPAKAQGFWQLMKVTAQEFGLEVNDEIDMRNDVESATRVACQFLRRLYNRYNDWALAAAAYNRGPYGLSKQMEEQNADNYYDMYLNTETSRYVYRILAYKLILQNPQDYGFNIRRCDMYPQVPFRTDTLSGRNVKMMTYARQHGCSYKMLRMMNPWIVSDQITNRSGKTYTIHLPVTGGTKRSVIANGKKDTSLIDRI